MTDRPIIFSASMVQALLAGRKTQTRRLATSPLRRTEVNDRLWVRESIVKTPAGISYVADGAKHYGAGGKLSATPSIHMPRWASRLTLQVTRVHFDRLQSITGHDCCAEGYPGEIDRDCFLSIGASHDWYRDLWNTLHDKDGERWNDDPMIVAITFNIVHSNIDRIAA